MTAIESILQQLAAATQRGEDKRVLLQLVEELRMAVLDMPLILKPEILEQLEAPPRRALAAATEEVAAKAEMPSAAPTAVEAKPVTTGQPLRAPLPPRRVVAVEEEQPPIIAPATAVAEAEPVAVVADQFVAAQLSKLPSEHHAFVPAPAAVHEVLELPVTDEMLEEVSAIARAPVPVLEPVIQKMEVVEAVPPVAETKPPSQPQPIGRRAELHEVLANQQAASLNERFSQPATVLAEAIAVPRIADLRKAISVAEKFQYVNELFRQDDSLFERSIKTINGFNIYAEAEYWIRRELATRLGWDEKSEFVQQFYALVRRRFT